VNEAAEKRKRGRKPLQDSQRKIVRSVRILPALEAHAIEHWGGLSAAVDDLLRKHRDAAARVLRAAARHR
jgi:hypothetical protein